MCAPRPGRPPEAEEAPVLTATAPDEPAVEADGPGGGMSPNEPGKGPGSAREVSPNEPGIEAGGADRSETVAMPGGIEARCLVG